MVLGYFIFINKSGYGFKLFFCPSNIEPLDTSNLYNSEIYIFSLLNKIILVLLQKVCKQKDEFTYKDGQNNWCNSITMAQKGSIAAI